jgi:hypothetical protein
MAQVVKPLLNKYKTLALEEMFNILCIKEMQTKTTLRGHF